MGDVDPQAISWEDLSCCSVVDDHALMHRIFIQKSLSEINVLQPQPLIAKYTKGFSHRPNQQTYPQPSVFVSS